MAEYLKQGRRKMGQIRTIRRGGEPKSGRPLGSGRGRMMEITPPPSTIQPFIYTNLERGSGGWQVNSAIARYETARVRNKKSACPSLFRAGNRYRYTFNNHLWSVEHIYSTVPTKLQKYESKEEKYLFEQDEDVVWSGACCALMTGVKTREITGYLWCTLCSFLLSPEEG